MNGEPYTVGVSANNARRSAWQSFWHFVSYHNAVSIGVAFLFLTTTGALAASPEIRNDVADAVYSQQQVVKSVDNSYIVGKDLSSWRPTVQITAVTEDTDNYYVAYDFHTIDVQDDMWQDVTKQNTLTVPKAQLAGSDLGLFVTKQLTNGVNWEYDRLTRTQTIERQDGEKQRVVATVYGGLVGKFLDSTEETLAGYTPVVTPTVPEESQSGSGVANAGSTSSGQSSASGSARAPIIQILGMNPALVPLKSSYSDLGVYVYDPSNAALGTYSAQGAGKVDTTTVGSYTVTYTVTGTTGLTTTATRTVMVYDPLKGMPQVEQQQNSTPISQLSPAASAIQGSTEVPDVGGSQTSATADTTSQAATTTSTTTAQ